MQKKTISNTELLEIIVCSVVALVVIPLLNGCVPESSALHISNFSINQWGRYFCYAVLAIFLLAAIICHTPDPIGMCLFAPPMLVLYFLGVAVAFLVHPNRRKKNTTHYPQ